MSIKKLSSQFDRVGLVWVGLIFAFIVVNSYYLARVLLTTWSYSDPGIVTAEGFVKGADFMALWPALGLAVGGEAELAYDREAIQLAQQQLTGIDTWADRRFLHPPTYLFMLYPLGQLSYLSALALWQVLPLLGFLFVMSRLRLPWAVFWLLPLSGAVVQTIASGQNGLLSGFFLAAGLLTLERRPVIAGILFGLMTFKPQLALLVGPTLLVGGCWRALGAMVATVAAAVVMSMAAFGLEPWFAFIGNIFFAQGQLAVGNLPWYRIPSAFVAARLMGLETVAAQIFQAAVALAAFGGVIWAWRRAVPFYLKAAALAAAIPLATPWIHDYDLVVLLVAMAWLIAEADREQIHHLEKAILCLVWMMPAVWIIEFLPIQGIPYGFLLVLAFYAMIVYRVWRFGHRDLAPSR